MDFAIGQKGEMMDDLISRKAVINKAITVPIAKIVTEDKVIYRRIVFVEDIENLPSAQPERKTGHWIKTARWGRVYKCNRCGNFLDFDGVNVGRGSTNFCPNCGAKMENDL